MFSVRCSMFSVQRYSSATEAEKEEATQRHQHPSGGLRNGLNHEVVAPGKGIPGQIPGVADVKTLPADAEERALREVGHDAVQAFEDSGNGAASRVVHQKEKGIGRRSEAEAHFQIIRPG